MINQVFVDHASHQTIQFELESAFFAEWYCNHYTGQQITYQPLTGHVLVHDPNPQPILHQIEDFQMSDYTICYTTQNTTKMQHCIRCRKHQKNSAS